MKVFLRILKIRSTHSLILCAWRLPDDCLTTAWQLPDDCLITAWGPEYVQNIFSRSLIKTCHLWPSKLEWSYNFFFIFSDRLGDAKRLFYSLQKHPRAREYQLKKVSLECTFLFRVLSFSNGTYSFSVDQMAKESVCRNRNRKMDIDIFLHSYLIIPKNLSLL